MKKYKISFLLSSLFVAVFSLIYLGYFSDIVNAQATGTPGTLCASHNAGNATWAGSAHPPGTCFANLPAYWASQRNSSDPAVVASWTYYMLDYATIPAMSDTELHFLLDSIVNLAKSGHGTIDGYPVLPTGKPLFDEVLKRAKAGTGVAYMRSVAQSGYSFRGPAEWASLTDVELHFIYGTGVNHQACGATAGLNNHLMCGNIDPGTGVQAVEDFIIQRVVESFPCGSTERMLWDHSCPDPGYKLYYKAVYESNPSCWSSGVAKSGTFLCQVALDGDIANASVNPPTTTGTSANNFPPGCTSSSGFSTSTGQKCDQMVLLVLGCTSTVGFSTTTGAKCDGTAAGSGGGAAGNGTISTNNGGGPRVQLMASGSNPVVLTWTSANLGHGSCSIKNELGNLVGGAWLGTFNSRGISVNLSPGTHTFTITCDSSISGYAKDNIVVSVGTRGNGLVITTSGKDTGTSGGADTNTSSTSFRNGAIVSVKNGTTLNVRSMASTSGTILGTQSYFAWGKIIGGPTVANGYTWWNIDWNLNPNPDGWSAQDFLLSGVTADMAGRGITGDTTNANGYNTNPNYDYDQACGDGKFPATVQVSGRGTAIAVWVPIVWETSNPNTRQFFTCKKLSQDGKYVIPESIYPEQVAGTAVPTKDPNDFNNSLIASVKYLGNGATEIRKVFTGKGFQAFDAGVAISPSQDSQLVNFCSQQTLSGGIGHPHPSNVTFTAVGITAKMCTYDCSLYNGSNKTNIYALGSGEIASDQFVGQFGNNLGVASQGCGF